MISPHDFKHVVAQIFGVVNGEVMIVSTTVKVDEITFGRKTKVKAEPHENRLEIISAAERKNMETLQSEIDSYLELKKSKESE